MYVFPDIQVGVILISDALFPQQPWQQLHPIPAGGVDVVQLSLRHMPGHQRRYGFIDGLRPQAAAKGQQTQLPGADPQTGAGGGPVGRKDLRTDGVAGDDVILALRQVLFRFRHRQQELIHLLRHHAVGNTGQGIGLVGHAGDVQCRRGQQNGGRNIAAGTHHHIRRKIPQNSFGAAAGRYQQTYAFGVIFDVIPAKTALDAHGAIGGKAKARPRHQGRLHAIGVAYKKDLAIRHPAAQLGGHRQCGIDMTGGTAAGKQNFHTDATPFLLSFGGRPKARCPFLPAGWPAPCRRRKRTAG